MCKFSAVEMIIRIEQVVKIKMTDMYNRCYKKINFIVCKSNEMNFESIEWKSNALDSIYCITI